MTRWRPASRPPTTECDVLVCLQPPNETPLFAIGWYDAIGWHCVGGYPDDRQHITHWQPLPPLPRRRKR